jgi:hypothetical protein
LFSLQKIIVSLFLVFLSALGYCGDPFSLKTGAREAGMAGVCLMNNDLWSSFNNQAGLAFNKSFTFGFNYENRFAIKELGVRSAGLVIPAGKVSLGVVYSNFGYSDFRRELIGLSSGMPLSDNIAAGVQIEYFSEKTIGEYHNNQILTCEAGIIMTVSENAKAGIHLFNPVPNSLRKSDMPSELRTDLGMNLSKELFAAVEARMSTGQKLIIKTGFEYEAAKKFMIRGGFSTENNSFCFGTGYDAGPARIDLGFATHEKLGITSSISMIFDIKSINRKGR